MRLPVGVRDAVHDGVGEIVHVSVGVRLCVGLLVNVKVHVEVGVRVPVTVRDWVGLFVGVRVGVWLGVATVAADQKPPANVYAAPLAAPASGCPTVPAAPYPVPLLKVLPPPSTVLRVTV